MDIAIKGMCVLSGMGVLPDLSLLSTPVCSSTVAMVTDLWCHLTYESSSSRFICEMTPQSVTMHTVYANVISEILP